MAGRLSVTASLVVPGLHHWPGAPVHRYYLATPHRHRFRMAVSVAVDDLDRQVEFHDLHRLIDEAVKTFSLPAMHATDLLDFGYRSCEHMAIALAQALDDLPVLETCVSEDDEFHVTYRPEG